MLIDIINDNAEQALLALVEHNQGSSWGVLHFQRSRLPYMPSPEDMLLTVRPVLGDRHGSLYFFRDGDVAIAWSGPHKATLDDLCARLYERYRFDGAGETLHRYYDLQAQGEELRLLCRHKMGPASGAPSHAPRVLAQGKLGEPPREQLAQFRTLAQKRLQRPKLVMLVVEDQPFSNKLLVGLLGRICRASSAYNAEAAMELYLTHAPDIAFIDIELPDINGHELAATIRRMDPDAYVVMVTANHYSEDVGRAKENGAKGFVVKPYSKQKILTCVEKYIRERRLKP